MTDDSEPARASATCRTIEIGGQGGPVIGASWGGVAAGSLALAADGRGFSVSVLDQLDQTVLALGPFDDSDVVAIWRSLAARTGLPLAILHPDGQVEHAFRQLGRLRLGAVQGRRRKPAPHGRRPRFLVRRKSARLPGRPLIYREPEMAAGGGR